LVLIYQLQDAEVVRLVRLGSHSELSLSPPAQWHWRCGCLEPLPRQDPHHRR
jgi:hypothetical protein